MSEKKAPVKNQHFVPQFYLRNFSTDNKSISTFILKSEKFIEHASISKQASKDYFYSDDMMIEEGLSKIEADAAESINVILEAPLSPLSLKDFARVLYFTVIQLGRTTAAADDNEESIKALCHEVQAFSARFGKNFPESPISYIPKKPVLQPLILHALAFETGMFDNLDYRILINKTTTPFITGDTPACLYNQFRERIGSFSYGIGSRGIQLYLPLSHLIAILFYDPQCYKVGFKKQSYFCIQNTCDINEFNKLIASSARNALFMSPPAPAKRELNQLAGYSKKFRIETTQVAESIQFEKSKCYTFLRTVSMYCKFRPSFIKELDKSKKITSQNTNKEGALMRPEAIESRARMDILEKAGRAQN